MYRFCIVGKIKESYEPRNSLILSRYNMATMIVYNSKLLRDAEKDKKREEIMEELKGLDTETLAAFLKLTKLR